MTPSLPLVQYCAPLAEPALTEEEAKQLETVFKALADRHRVTILNRLIGAGDDAVEKRGSHAYFSLAPGALEQVCGLLGATP